MRRTRSSRSSTPPHLGDLQTWRPQTWRPGELCCAFRLIFWTRTADANEEETLFRRGVLRTFNLTCPLAGPAFWALGSFRHLTSFCLHMMTVRATSRLTFFPLLLPLNSSYSHSNSPSCQIQHLFFLATYPSSLDTCTIRHVTSGGPRQSAQRFCR
jgi:hypothetical protein